MEKKEINQLDEIYRKVKKEAEERGLPSPDKPYIYIEDGIYVEIGVIQ